MAQNPQLPDEISPRGRWFGVGSRTSERTLRDGETPATEAEPETQDDSGYNARVLPTYRTYTRGEQRDATAHYSASWAGYYGDAPRTKIADEGLETPINQDGYVYGPDAALAASGQYPAAMSRGPTKPYASTPPAVTVITRNGYQTSHAGDRIGGAGGIPASDADMAAWLMRGDF